MTKREFLDNYENQIYFLQEELNRDYEGQNYGIIENIISSLRKYFYKVFQKEIYTNFRPFGNKYNSLNATFVSNNWKIAIREFYGFWYTVELFKDDFSIIQTDSPDNYPLHCSPESMKSFIYPEIALMETFFKKYPEQESEILYGYMEE